MQVREVELSEIQAVIELYDEYERPRAAKPTLEEIQKIFDALKQFGGCVFGAFDGGKVVGTCTINICPNFSWSGRPYAIIENVIVSKSHRNQGVGNAILLQAKEYAQSKSCYKVALMTGSKEEQVLEFYRSAGFERSKIGFQSRFDA